MRTVTHFSCFCCLHFFLRALFSCLFLDVDLKQLCMLKNSCYRRRFGFGFFFPSLYISFQNSDREAKFESLDRIYDDGDCGYSCQNIENATSETTKLNFEIRIEKDRDFCSTWNEKK